MFFSLSISFGNSTIFIEGLCWYLIHTKTFLKVNPCLRCSAVSSFHIVPIKRLLRCLLIKKSTALILEILILPIITLTMLSIKQE